MMTVLTSAWGMRAIVGEVFKSIGGVMGGSRALSFVWRLYEGGRLGLEGLEPIQGAGSGLG